MAARDGVTTMNLLSPAFLLLALLFGAVWYFGAPAGAAVKRAEQDLTPEELAAFRERYVRPGNRAGMPDRFAAMALATDRLRRVWLLSAGAVIAWIVATYLLGHDLGLGRGQDEVSP